MRWIQPGSLDARYREHEFRQRFERIEAMMDKRRSRASEIAVIVDRDPGDEDGTWSIPCGVEVSQ